jgi:hypothetical protein
LKQLNVNLKISIPSKCDDFRIVNVKTLDGISGDISCYGFDEQGNPVKSPNDRRRKYIVTGGYCSGVSLMRQFTNGMTTYKLEYVRRDPHNPADQSMIPQQVPEFEYSGFAAVALALSRAGCHADPAVCEKSITNLIKNGVLNIYCTRLCHTYGLDENYNGFFNSIGGDKWEFGSKFTHDDIDFDITNDFLRSIGSNWRILTSKVQKALQLKAFKQLEKNPI